MAITMEDIEADIVKVLYDHALGPLGKGDDLHCLAAQEIERLRNENKQLKNTLALIFGGDTTSP